MCSKSIFIMLIVVSAGIKSADYVSRADNSYFISKNGSGQFSFYAGRRQGRLIKCYRNMHEYPFSTSWRSVILHSSGEFVVASYLNDDESVPPYTIFVFYNSKTTPCAFLFSAEEYNFPDSMDIDKNGVDEMVFRSEASSDSGSSGYIHVLHFRKQQGKKPPLISINGYDYHRNIELVWNESLRSWNRAYDVGLIK